MPSLALFLATPALAEPPAASLAAVRLPPTSVGRPSIEWGRAAVPGPAILLPASPVPPVTAPAPDPSPHPVELLLALGAGL